MNKLINNTGSNLILLVCFLLAFNLNAMAQRPRSILGPGIGAGNYHVPFHIPSGETKVLSADTTYVLTGWTFVDSMATLVIPPGTVIRGDKSSMGSLIIKRGGKIVANGTLADPIIFTSDMPKGFRAPGDWGGIVICGSAPTNNGTSTHLEGGFGISPNTDAKYGGTNNEDSSGVFRYVRIEFPGDNFNTENEINGLTLAGVGRKTAFDHVQISFSNDDDVQFFGGTIDAKYLISWRCRDDNFDTEYGHDGRLQFLYAKRDPDLSVDNLFASTNGIESDNHPTIPASLPKTKTRISNLTLVGPAIDTNVSKNLSLSFRWYCIVSLQTGTELSLNNSILLGFDNGIEIWDQQSQTSAQNGTLQIRNTSLQARTLNIFLGSAPIPGFNAVTWFTNGTGNVGETPRNVPDVGLSTNAFTLSASNDPVPPLGTEADIALADFSGSLFSDPWFDNSATYRGAFIPGLPMDQQWSAGWSNFDPQNYDPESIILNIPYSTGWNLVSPPLSNTNLLKTSLFPNALGSVFAFENGVYAAKDTLTKGMGYWAYYSSSATEEISGTGFDSIGFSANNVPAGGRWFLIGTVSTEVPLSSLYSIPAAGIDLGGISLFGFSNSYIVPSTLQPGRGYWLYVYEPCTIVVSQ